MNQLCTLDYFQFHFSDVVKTVELQINPLYMYSTGCFDLLNHYVVQNSARCHLRVLQSITNIPNINGKWF